jgi:hypothetical protein
MRCDRCRQVFLFTHDDAGWRLLKAPQPHWFEFGWWVWPDTYIVTAAAIGLAAYAILASPLCPASAEHIGGWHALAVWPMVGAASVGAVLLRGFVRRRDTPSLLLAGVLWPIVASLAFALVFTFLERWIQGRLGFAEACAEAGLACWYGPLYCMREAHFTIPLGIAGAWLLRRVSRTHEAQGDKASGARG